MVSLPNSAHLGRGSLMTELNQDSDRMLIRDPNPIIFMPRHTDVLNPQYPPPRWVRLHHTKDGIASREEDRLTHTRQDIQIEMPDVRVRRIVQPHCYKNHVIPSFAVGGVIHGSGIRGSKVRGFGGFGGIRGSEFGDSGGYVDQSLGIRGDLLFSPIPPRKHTPSPGVCNTNCNDSC
jgi:hypothetical protein